MKGGTSWAPAFGLHAPINVCTGGSFIFVLVLVEENNWKEGMIKRWKVQRNGEKVFQWGLLMVQWLRLYAPNAWVLSLDQGTRPHTLQQCILMLQLKIKDPECGSQDLVSQIS